MWSYQLKNWCCENLKHFCTNREFYSPWHSCLLLWVLFFSARHWNFKKEGDINAKTQFCLRDLIFHNFLPFSVWWSKKKCTFWLKSIISGCYLKWQKLNIIILSCYQTWFIKIKCEDATYSEHFPFKEVWPQSSGRQTEARRHKYNNHILPSWRPGRTGVLR